MRFYFMPQKKKVKEKKREIKKKDIPVIAYEFNGALCAFK